ncbi:MAG: HAD family phosphatase [Chloroflexota bacterium]
MKNSNPALIFDFGGVLLDWNPHYLFEKYFDMEPSAVDLFMRDIDFFAWNYEQDRGRPFAEGVAELSEKFPKYAKLIKAYDDFWEETIIGPMQLTVDMLMPLREHGYMLYGLTNWSFEKFRLVNQKYAFLDLFETVVVSGEVKLAKPDPRIFGLILEKIGRPADECIFIDDSETNILAAQQLGFMTIRFETTNQLSEELSRLGVVWIG